MGPGPGSRWPCVPVGNRAVGTYLDWSAARIGEEENLPRRFWRELLKVRLLYAPFPRFPPLSQFLGRTHLVFAVTFAYQLSGGRDRQRVKHSGLSILKKV